MDTLNIQEKVAKFVVVNRILSGKTQSHVAKATNRTFQQIQKYENCINKVSSDILLFVCKAFGYDMHYLLNGRPEQLLSKLKPRQIQKVKAKFQEIESRIEEERKLQAHYEKILPKLEAEMNYIVTYKDPK
jgi:transcriptional regulator with XRE-family HTH domain